MKRLALTLLLLAVCAIMSACGTPQTPEEAARRQRYEMLGDRLLALGLKVGEAKGIVTKEDSAYLREFSDIIIKTPPAPKPADPTKEPEALLLLPAIDTKSGK